MEKKKSKNNNKLSENKDEVVYKKNLIILLEKLDTRSLKICDNDTDNVIYCTVKATTDAIRHYMEVGE